MNGMDGFTYRGRHISSFGEIIYAPNEDERGDIAVDYSIEDDEIQGVNGGYLLSNWAPPKKFDLRCYYEEITNAQRNALLRWFNRNTDGRLVFDRRPYVYYEVFPTERVEFEDYCEDNGEGDVYTGILTIH